MICQFVMRMFYRATIQNVNDLRHLSKLKYSFVLKICYTLADLFINLNCYVNDEVNYFITTNCLLMYAPSLNDNFLQITLI